MAACYDIIFADQPMRPSAGLLDGWSSGPVGSVNAFICVWGDDGSLRLDYAFSAHPCFGQHTVLVLQQLPLQQE